MLVKLIGSPRASARLLLSITALAGIVSIVTFLWSPSETGSQFLFGLSRARLLTGVVFAFLLAVNIGALLWVGVKPKDWQLNIEVKLIGWFTAHITYWITALSFMALAIGMVLLSIIPPVIGLVGFMEPLGARIGGLMLWLFFSTLLSIIFIKLFYKELLSSNKVVAVVDHLLLLTVLFIVTFFLYEHLLIWTGAANQLRYSYWNLLADEFLRGRLHLENPPQIHDLTFHNGKWYVPMPPFPAVLMMPLAYLIGGENIDTGDFSIFLSAVNALFVFLILDQLVRRKWINLSRVGMLLLVALFAFGNPHLWVGIRGRVWFFSQIVMVTFLALAVFAALKSWSPWVVGISLGAAIATRPNGIMTWPFVFAIAMQILKEERGNVDYKQILNWSMKSILPMGMAVAGLLMYNYARFGNYLDFGYTTIHGDPVTVANAQTYGIFSPHFIIPNIKAMFFRVPAIRPGGQWPILPSTTGMSVFLVTPPLIYLFRRYEPKWWIWGAWASVFFNLVLLLLYHNTGAHQFGYRYILDFIVPLIAMLAVALGGKIPWHFVALLLFSIVFNIYGAFWFING